MYQLFSFWYLCFILVECPYSTTARFGNHCFAQKSNFAIGLSCGTVCGCTVGISCGMTVGKVSGSSTVKFGCWCVKWWHGSCLWVSVPSSSFRWKYLMFSVNPSFFTRKNSTGHDPLAIYNVYHIDFFHHTATLTPIISIILNVNHIKSIWLHH